MSSLPENPVESKVADGAAWITLDRPAALNAISPAMLEGIEAGLDRSLADPLCRAIVLRANGRAFCAGADLKVARKVFGDDTRATMGFLRAISRLCDRIEESPKPVVAAVGGLALAGGLELVLACDVVVASAAARFGDAHAAYGLLPGGGGSVRLPRKVGINLAKYMMLTAEQFDAAAMHAAGLVALVTAPEALDEAVRRLVATLAARSPLGLQRMKFLVDQGMDQPRGAAMKLELLVNELHNTSADRAEGLAAFEQKRPPVFHGG